MKGLRNIARAISPFTSSKSKEKSADDYSWDLTNVDIEVLMRDFYTTYNPSRIDTIRTILDEYKGEELRMLQQLCNRYKIREEKMQEYIDNAIIVKPLPVITQPVRKPSVRFDTTQDQDSVSTRDNNVDKQYTKNNYDMYTDFTWDLTNVDMATALKLIYKELNPQKAPNVATLSTKTYDDFTLILQQLCKRHSLSEVQMQEYLDRCPKYSPEFGSGYSSAPSSRSQSISQSDQQSITSSVNSSRDPMRSSNNFYVSKNDVKTIPPLHVDTKTDRLMPRDTFQKVRSNGSFPSPQPSIVSDTGSISSRDNYSQSTTKSGDRRNTPTAAIASPPPPPPIESMIVRDDDDDDGEDVTSMSRGINEDEDDNKVPPNKIGVDRRGLTGRTDQADNQGRVVPTNSGIGRKEDRSNHESNDKVEAIVKIQALDTRNGSVAGVDRYVEFDNESLKSSMRAAAAAGSGDRDNDKKDNKSSKKAFKSDSTIKESTTSNSSTSSVTSRAVLLDKYQQQQYELEIETQKTLLKAEEGNDDVVVVAMHVSIDEVLFVIHCNDLINLFYSDLQQQQQQQQQVVARN
jgi:predicted solute-binding protein